MRVRAMFLVSLASALLPVAIVAAQQPAAATSNEERVALHSGVDWQLIATHLPDPATGTAANFEVAADVLRARRFPEDALDYYGYALARGGDLDRLLNKMGVVRLELHQDKIARELFLRVVHAHKKDSQAWNNLGVTEYAAQNYQAAIMDYRRAVKLNKHSAVYFSNLGIAYFETKDMQSAREAFARAVEIDPSIMRDHDQGGTTAHVLGSRNYAELCFEMAKIYARSKDIESMRVWLARACEGGFDVRHGIHEEAVFHPYQNDAQLKLMLDNTAQIQKRSIASTSTPSLGAAPEATHRVLAE
ncbi:MAG: tetratricopeptide repeat protein [Acidobacteriota bacterium]